MEESLRLSQQTEVGEREVVKPQQRELRFIEAVRAVAEDRRKGGEGRLVTALLACAEQQHDQREAVQVCEAI